MPVRLTASSEAGEVGIRKSEGWLVAERGRGQKAEA